MGWPVDVNGGKYGPIDNMGLPDLTKIEQAIAREELKWCRIALPGSFPGTEEPRVRKTRSDKGKKHAKRNMPGLA